MDDFLKLTILTTSKQYTSLSLNLVNNVSKSFPEFVKNARKTIQTHFAKVISLQDDLRKCKANFSKLLEKYSRLVRETEMLLNLRSTSAMLENKVVDTDAQNLKEEGFSNLSFSRMLSKITPSEKKPQEKSREMIRELEQLELQLQNDVRRINVTRSEMLLEISKLYKTVEAVELERLTAMNEGASRFLLALDVVIDKHLDSFRSLLGAAELFDGQVELSLMFQKLAPIENVNQPTFLSNLDIEQERVIKISFIYGLNLQVDSLVDLIDHFHGLTHKLSCTMTEMLDVEQIFLKGTKRLFEKQGFYAIPNMDTIYDLANSSQSAAWLLKNYESENTRKSWELIFCLVGLIEELKIKDYDIYSEEISHQLDLIEKRLSFDRKELISVQSTNMRKIEQASIQSSKCRIKLSKVRQSLKERRNILRTTKGSTTIDQDKSFDEISADQDTPANIEEEVEVSTMMRRSSVKQTLEKANSTLKQVVGFESAADRLSRITSQIASLEDEEIQLMEVETQTNSNLITALETAESELKVCMKSIQDYLMVDIESIKGVLVTYFRSQAEKYDSLKSGSANSKLNEESDVLIKHDLSKFCKMLCSISELDFESSIFDTLSSESFESIKSDTITEEKKMLGIISNINRNVSDGCSVENDIVENRNNFQDNNSLAENNVTEPIFINHEESVEDVVPSQVAFGDSQEDKSSGKPNDENYLGSDELRQIASQTPKIDSPSKLSADFELKKFGLSNQDKVLESYSCALYPRKGLLTQGRLFITQHYLAFSGWPETRVLLCMIDIVSIEKTNTLGYIPNAITIKVEDKSEYFFGSLMDRDQCHSLIKNLIEVEKRITELHGSEGVKINRQLEYGYQTKSFFNKTKISELGEKNENQKAVDENSIDTAIVEAGDSDDLITEAVEFSFTPFLSNNTVVFLGEHQFSCSSSELWSKCWLQSSDYRFLNITIIIFLLIWTILTSPFHFLFSFS